MLIERLAKVKADKDKELHLDECIRQLSLVDGSNPSAPKKAIEDFRYTIMNLGTVFLLVLL